MTIKRYAARADANRPQIVEVFRAAGCSVYDLRMPVDLLIGKNGKTLLVEVKTAKGKIRPAQAAFMAGWLGGAVVTVRDVEGARTAVGMLG